MARAAAVKDFLIPAAKRHASASALAPGNRAGSVCGSAHGFCRRSRDETGEPSCPEPSRDASLFLFLFQETRMWSSVRS